MNPFALWLKTVVQKNSPNWVTHGPVLQVKMMKIIGFSGRQTVTWTIHKFMRGSGFFMIFHTWTLPFWRFHARPRCSKYGIYLPTWAHPRRTTQPLCSPHRCLQAPACYTQLVGWFTKKNGCWFTSKTFGGFLKWGHTQIIHCHKIFHVKPSITTISGNSIIFETPKIASKKTLLRVIPTMACQGI